MLCGYVLVVEDFPKKV